MGKIRVPDRVACCKMELRPLPVRDQKTYAVRVRNACKRYGDLPVLANLDMSVQKGTIYGLLGASGCGKTTLLSCVVGRRHLDSGCVQVLGGPPCLKGRWLPHRKLGYMPQETALYKNITIRETLRYFGWIFGMSTQESDERLAFLVKLLDLPDRDRLTKTLSGGQMRRVSLSVALLHEPEVLILDEPTVGMDPVLRAVIWEHFLHLAGHGGVTVLLTTHYIDEASQAHVIGLLRNGRLLDEDLPTELLDRYRVSTLEDVFLQLSLRQEEKTDSVACGGQTTDVNHKSVLNSLGKHTNTGNGIADSNEIVRDNADLSNGSCHKVTPQSHTKDTRGFISKGSTKAVLFKNIVCTTRDPSYMAFIFGLCIVAVSGLYVGLGFEPRHLRLAVVNHDSSAADPHCRRLHRPSNCSFDQLSCRYLSYVTEPTIVKEFYDSPESALESVRRGKTWGVLYFHDNFTQGLLERIREGRMTDDDSLDHGSIRVRLDMSNQVIGWKLREQLYSMFAEFSKDMLAACGLNTNIANIPVRFNEPVYGDKSPSFIHYTAPAVVSAMMFFFGVALSVWAIAYERNQGLLDRNIIAGLRSLEIFFGYFLSQSLLMCGQASLVIVLGIFVYSFQCDGDLALVIVLCLLQGICGMTLGFVISAACDDEITATVIASGSIQPMLYLCGIIWPLEGMHVVLRYVALVMPLTLPIRAMRAIMTRAWGLASSEVALGFAASFIWIGAFIAVCWVVIRIKKL